MLHVNHEFPILLSPEKITFHSLIGNIPVCSTGLHKFPESYSRSNKILSLHRHKPSSYHTNKISSFPYFLLVHQVLIKTSFATLKRVYKEFEDSSSRINIIVSVVFKNFWHFLNKNQFILIEFTLYQ